MTVRVFMVMKNDDKIQLNLTAEELEDISSRVAVVVRAEVKADFEAWRAEANKHLAHDVLAVLGEIGIKGSFKLLWGTIIFIFSTAVGALAAWLHLKH